MTIDFLIKNYNFNDIEIINVKLNDNKLVVDFNINAHLDLIANGYRPELDMNVNQTFVFEIENIKLNIKKPYRFNIIKEDCYYILLNDNKIKIISNNVEVYMD